MFLSNLSINRPVMVTMIILVFLVFGALAYFSLALSLMPDLNIPYITIQVIYPGASPTEVETQITKKVEDAVSTVSMIDFIQSYSMESASVVVIRFKMSKNVDIANQEVKDKVDAILNDLPDDAEQPVIDKVDTASFPVMELIFTGNVDAKTLREYADRHLGNRLSQFDGVAKVDVSGGEEREVRVELDDRVVFSNSISLPQLAQILATQNMNLPGGSFDQRDQEFSVRFQGEYTSVDDIRNTHIPTAFGEKKLSELATVLDTGAKVTKRSTYFNNIDKFSVPNVVRLSITKSSDGNAVSVSSQVNAAMAGIRSELPEGTQLEIIDDYSDFIKSSVEDTMSNVLMGILFTGFILLLFLHDLRSTLIVALSMPTSIIATFLLLQLSGFSLNIMTLMGLSTAVGVLVTNSVVVLENIFRFKRMGMDRREAAGKGTSEIAVAVIASTLTNIVVFLPIASMSSMVGQFFKEFALTVTYATIFSLLISFTLTPMLASRILPKTQKKGAFGRGFDHWFDGFERWYQKLLWNISKKRVFLYLIMVASLLLLVGSFALVGMGKIGFEFFPMLDQGNISIKLELPVGYSLDETQAVMKEIETRVVSHPEVKHFLATIGSMGNIDTGSNLGLASVKLVDADERTIKTNELTNLLIKELADIPNAQIRVSTVSMTSDSNESPVDFFLKGQDMDKLVEIGEQILEKARDVDGLVNFTSSTRAGRPEIKLLPRREVLSQVGATPYDLAMTLRTAVEGLVLTSYREEGEEYDLRVTLNEGSTDSPEKIANLPVVTPTGTYAMSQLADVVYTSGVNKIIHREKNVSIEFTGDLAMGVPLGDVTKQMDQLFGSLDLPSGYSVQWGGDAQMMNETIVDMTRTFLLAILLTYMLLAAILESFTQPLIILFTLPLALIGVLGFCWMTGTTLNLIAMMSIVMLVGIVVNNAILMLDYTNQLRREGKGPREALLIACPTKLRPIFMSSMAIMLGMLPMALGIGSSGAEMRQPMGIVSIGGIVASTLLTLVVIPALYMLTTHRAKDPLKELPHLRMLEENDENGNGE